MSTGTNRDNEFRENLKGFGEPMYAIPLSQNFANMVGYVQTPLAANNPDAPNQTPSPVMPQGFGVSFVKHDPGLVAANAMTAGDDLRGMSNIYPKSSGIAEILGGACALMNETAQVLKGQKPANSPEAPDLLMRPAPVVAFLPSAGSSGPSLG